MKTADYIPRWTRRAVIKGSGRDPLGLSRVSDAFTDLLLPSIITTTYRARYYSFYPWALREGAAAVEQGGNGPSDYNEQLRRREAAFGMVSQLGNETGLSIVGSEQINKHLAEAVDGEDVDVTFRVLPSNEIGGFGQYYGGCLRTLWIGDWDEDGIWRVSDRRGMKLADAFVDSVKDTAYASDGHAGQSKLSFKILQDSATLFSLDAIRTPEAQGERELLTRIFFDLDEDADTSVISHRQATLGQLLHVLNSCEAIQSLPARNDISGSCIFWPHYYGCLYGADEKSVPYDAHPVFAETGAYWRQFCVHQFFAYAAEELLQAILDAISNSSDGMTKQELVDELLATNFTTELEDATGETLPGPSALLNYFTGDRSPEEVQQQFSADHDLAEWWIYGGGSEASLTTRLARAFVLLCELYAKWRHSDDVTLHDVEIKAGGEWWVGTCFEWGDEWLSVQPDWHDTLSDLVDATYARHELIRFQKGKLEASWVERNDDGRYMKMQDLTPEFRSNRHPNVATVFQDLCILEDGGSHEPLQLTEVGRDLLKEVIQARS